LEFARNKLTDEDHKELMASDLRGALEGFGRISGKIDNEKILDQLFASFCIGK
jgi:tRNA modification GTPase